MQELKLQEQEHQALTTHENTKRLQQTEHRKLSTDQRLVDKSSAQGDKWAELSPSSKRSCSLTSEMALFHELYKTRLYTHTTVSCRVKHLTEGS